jgi:hypothetical protein
MDDRIVEDRISKLPKWAQQYIEELSDENSLIYRELLEAENRLKTFASVPEPVNPDLPPPSGKAITKGYALRTWKDEFQIVGAWSKSGCHGADNFDPESDEPPINHGFVASQGAIALYSTKELAIAAARYLAYQQYLKSLDAIAKLNS